MKSDKSGPITKAEEEERSAAPIKKGVTAKEIAWTLLDFRDRPARTYDGLLLNF